MGGGLTGAYGRKVGLPGRVGVLACGAITEVKHPILHLWLSYLGGRDSITNFVIICAIFFCGHEVERDCRKRQEDESTI